MYTIEALTAGEATIQYVPSAHFEELLKHQFTTLPQKKCWPREVPIGILKLFCNEPFENSPTQSLAKQAGSFSQHLCPLSPVYLLGGSCLLYHVLEALERSTRSSFDCKGSQKQSSSPTHISTVTEAVKTPVHSFRQTEGTPFNLIMIQTAQQPSLDVWAYYSHTKTTRHLSYSSPALKGLDTYSQ